MAKFVVGVEVYQTSSGDIVAQVEADTIEQAREKAKNYVKSLPSNEFMKLVNKIDEFVPVEHEVTGADSPDDEYYATGYEPDVVIP